MQALFSPSRLLICSIRAADSGLGVWDIAGLHKNYIAGPADGDSAFAFRNIDTNSVHDKNSFEMN